MGGIRWSNLRSLKFNLFGLQGTIFQKPTALYILFTPIVKKWTSYKFRVKNKLNK